MFDTFSVSAGTSTTGCRAQWHGMARLSHDSAVPGPLSRHGGTIRHGTANMPCRVVPCLAGPCLSVPVPVPCRAARLAIYSRIMPYIKKTHALIALVASYLYKGHQHAIAHCRGITTADSIEELSS